MMSLIAPISLDLTIPGLEVRQAAIVQGTRVQALCDDKVP